MQNYTLLYPLNQGYNGVYKQEKASKGLLDNLFISKTVFARISRVLIALMYTRHH